MVCSNEHIWNSLSGQFIGYSCSNTDDISSMVVATLAELSISVNADLLRFPCTILSRIYREWLKNKKVCNEWQFCWGETSCLN